MGSLGVEEELPSKLLEQLLAWLAAFRPGLSARCRGLKALKASIAGEHRKAEKKP
jgi:hypothetical protein